MRVGENVTVVVSRGGIPQPYGTRRARMERIVDNGFTWQAVGGDSGLWDSNGHSCLFADEGFTWARGWLGREGRRALLVANSLR